MVPIAELAATRELGCMLTTQPLGAGLGVALHDPEAKIGGLLHTVLPWSRMDLNQASQQPAMFVDTGVKALLEAMTELGANPKRVRLVAAGAADWISPQPNQSIGVQNALAIEEIAKELGLPLSAMRLGGRDNCSLMLHVASGNAWIKFSGQSNHVLLCQPSTST